MEESQLAFAYAGSGKIGATMAILPCIVRSDLRYDVVDKAVCAFGILGVQCPCLTILMILAMPLLLPRSVRID